MSVMSNNEVEKDIKKCTYCCRDITPATGYYLVDGGNNICCADCWDNLQGKLPKKHKLEAQSILL